MLIRITLAAAAIAASPIAAFAQARPDSLAMSCQQARNLVARQGSVVIGTGPHIYERFVSDARFCPAGDAARPVDIPTRDTPACPIGGVCFTPQGTLRFDD